MRYAIIAAGEGSRLAAEGVAAPKPLVEVCGEPLIDRLIRIFAANEATEVVVICNALRPEVAAHLRALIESVEVPKITVVVKTTPSSMHSFYELSRVLKGGGEPFILTTVDTIFTEEEFSGYVEAFKQAVETSDGLFAVTDYIDDEKPLHVAVGEDMSITAFTDVSANPRYISGGIYGLTVRSIATLEDCMERGVHRMRNFQRALIESGCHIKAYPFTKILDIDHASDITKAEAFINGKDF